MKKRYFYVAASFMRKDIANTWCKVDSSGRWKCIH